MTLTGASSVNTGSLQLTQNQASQASSAFFPTAMSTTQFSTNFAFQLLDPLADGITFTIQGDKPNAIGSSGSGLGYQGIAKSIALKFGLRDTTGASDNSTGIYVNGAAPTTPSISLAGSGIDLHSGHIFQLGLQYDGTTEAISLTDTSTNTVWKTSVAEDIPSIIGGNTAYFGFTAGTGAATANADVAKPEAATATTSLSATANILNWNYVNQSGTVTPPTDPIVLSPTTLNFGNVTLSSTSAAQTLYLTNTGTVAIQVVSITPSDPSISASEGSCSIAGTPGSTCKSGVTFAPTRTGPFSGSVIINYFLGASSLPSGYHNVTLHATGNGVAPSLTLTPTIANFGSVVFGQTGAPRTFTVTNHGTVAVTFAELATSASFHLSSGASCTTLLAGKSCILPVVFNPASVGAISGTLRVTYFDANGRAVTETSNLNGIGLPLLTISPATLDFGTVDDWSTVLKVVTFTNSSPLPVTVNTNVIRTGDAQLADSSVFVTQRISACSAVTDPTDQLLTFAPGASCSFELSFTPGAAAAYSGTFGFSGPGGINAVTLTGRGNGKAVPQTVVFLPSVVDIGPAPIEVGAGFDVVAKNISNTPVTISGYYPDNPYFHINPYGCSGAPIPPGETCHVQADFNALIVGSASAQLFLGLDSGKSQTLTVMGIGAYASRAITPTNLNFGDVAVGTTITKTITITNTNYFPIKDNFYAGGVTHVPGIFNTSGSTCPFSYQYDDPYDYTGLLPGASCTIAISFTPTASASYSDSIGLLDSPTAQVITLTGQGMAVSPTTPFIDFGKSFTANALSLSGPTTVTSGVLQLTSGTSSAASSAFYATAVPTSSFSTDFTFQLLDPTAEGITFTIQGDNPNAVGLGGGGLGYQGIAKSIAVKFDLKDTAGEGVDSTGIYINGAAPTIPATSLATFGIDLHSGHLFSFHLTYNGTMLTINLTDTVTNAVWTTQVAEDIPAIVGGNTAYFGFTAGSGTPALTSDATESERAKSMRPAPTASAAAQPPATSRILTWIYVGTGETKTAQTITFPSLSGQSYGIAPIQLSAAASSGLPVSYTVKGPAKQSGSTLSISGAGDVSVTATQSGNASFAAATSVTRSFTVAKAVLSVTATSLSRPVGAANPIFGYRISGFVDGDPSSVVSGNASLTTTATSKSPIGSYPITFSNEGLAAANYSFRYVMGILTITSASCPIIDYSGGFGPIDLTMNGGAKLDGGALELTDGGLFEARSAFYSTALPTSSFTTDFTLQLADPAADGITFVLQSNNAKAVGEPGGGLGYAGIPHSVAIKLDLHNNAGEGIDSTGTYVNGAYPSVPSIDMAPAGIDLHSGHVFAVHLAYANSLTMGSITDTATGVTASMNFPGNIPQIVGDRAWFGFTAGTGAHSAIQKILTWSYHAGTGCPAD